MNRIRKFLRSKKGAAMVEYALGDHVVAHYRIVRGTEAPSQNARMRATTERGVTTITWRDATFEHALVSDLAADDLVALAQATFSAR